MLEGGIIYIAIKSTITVVEIIYKLETEERQEICQKISEQITGVRRPITTKETTKIDIPKIVPEPEPELEPDPEEDIIGKAMKTILEKAIMNRTYSTTKKIQTSTKSNNVEDQINKPEIRSLIITGVIIIGALVILLVIVVIYRSRRSYPNLEIREEIRALQPIQCRLSFRDLQDENEQCDTWKRLYQLSKTPIMNNHV